MEVRRSRITGGWKLEVKIRRADEDVGSEFSTSIRDQEVRRNEPNWGMLEDRAGDGKRKSDLMKSRGQRLAVKRASPIKVVSDSTEKLIKFWS